MNDRLCVRIREAARLLGLSVRTTWTYARRGVIPCLRPGGKGSALLFPVEGLRRWVEEQAKNGRFPKDYQE